VERNEAGAILEATQELLLAILQANSSLEPADIGSVFFTLTEDLTDTYPAQAARDLGWQLVPLLCGREIPVPGGLPRCIRVLIHWNTGLPQESIQHVYLGEAACLRPDVNGNA
jgi:chorismate mutase